MRAVDIIRRKRDGGELSRAEIDFLVRGYTESRLEDYQIAALLMAIFFRGMSAAEIAGLTDAMRRSGAVLDLSELVAKKVDKHSTGGVGDKTSLVIAPVLAACGLVVPMISGRGLGHSGGTLDKLESIPGFRVNLSLDEFRRVLRATGAALIGQTEDVAPADRKMYALRDVTSTVDSLPLIVSSIMSKKLAEGLDALVLDVKTGSGAFMKRKEDAVELARAMVGIGNACGTRTVALVTDMNQPLGRAAGNACEVIEALETLKGRGPKDLVALCRELSAWALELGGAAADLEAGRALFDDLIASGRARGKFREIIAAQEGDARVVDDYDRLPRARSVEPLSSPQSGYVAALDTEKAGFALCLLGAGRETVEADIDPAVGIEFLRKIGDRVERGEPLALLSYNDRARLDEAKQLLAGAYSVASEASSPPSLIYDVITG